jgi:hypothetical protein
MALDGLQRDRARRVEIAGEEQRVREAGQDAHGEYIRTRASGRDGAAPVLDCRTDIASLDYLRARDLDGRLDVR